MSSSWRSLPSASRKCASIPPRTCGLSASAALSTTPDRLAPSPLLLRSWRTRPKSAKVSPRNVRNPDAAAKGYISFIVTPELFARFTEKQDWGFAIILQGKFLTITSITFK